jgi:hypothetical protein
MSYTSTVQTSVSWAGYAAGQSTASRLMSAIEADFVFVGKRTSKWRLRSRFSRGAGPPTALPNRTVNAYSATILLP